jgi:hypothetical protein
MALHVKQLPAKVVRLNKEKEGNEIEYFPTELSDNVLNFIQAIFLFSSVLSHLMNRSVFQEKLFWVILILHRHDHKRFSLDPASRKGPSPRLDLPRRGIFKKALVGTCDDDLKFF